jgi:hypothetical protein
LRKAYDAWLAQKPFKNPNADPHPFVPKLYETPGTREAAEANAKAATNLRLPPLATKAMSGFMRQSTVRE